MHPGNLRRRAHELGVAVSRRLKVAQLQFACDLLLTSDLILEDVARRAAFGSRRSFLRAFQRELRQTPQSYRRSKVSLDRPRGKPDID